MAFKYSIDFKGQGTIVRRLPATWAAYSNLAGKTLFQEGKAVLQFARLLAPIRTGFLRRSGYCVQVPLARGNDSTVVIGFRAAYAAIVHETHPTRAKFLEEAMRVFMIGMRARMEANIRKEWR